MQGIGIAHLMATGIVEFHIQDRGIIFITGKFLKLSINYRIIIITNIRFMTEIDTIRNMGTDGKTEISEILSQTVKIKSFQITFVGRQQKGAVFFPLFS